MSFDCLSLKSPSLFGYPEKGERVSLEEDKDQG